MLDSLSRVHQVTTYLFLHSCLGSPYPSCSLAHSPLLTLPCSCLLSPFSASITVCLPSRVHWVTTYLFWCSCLLALTPYILHSPSLYLGPSCSLTLLIFPASIPFAHCQGFVGSLVIFQDFLSKVCRSSSIFLCFIC